MHKMHTKQFDIDLEDYKLFCQENSVLEGFYLTAYMKTKATNSLETWINKKPEVEEHG